MHTHSGLPPRGQPAWWTGHRPLPTQRTLLLLLQMRDTAPQTEQWIRGTCEPLWPVWEAVSDLSSQLPLPGLKDVKTN